MYCNLYVPQLQHVNGVVQFFRGHRGALFASSALMDPISKEFVASIHRYCRDQDVPMVDFVKGQRKDDVAHEYLARFTGQEGVLFIGRAQEKSRVFRTEKRRNPETGATYPWIVSATGIVNQFYVYAVDAEFGPFFIKFSSYFPYTAKLHPNLDRIWEVCADFDERRTELGVPQIEVETGRAAFGLAEREPRHPALAVTLDAREHPLELCATPTATT
jgi:hypothetical protein